MLPYLLPAAPPYLPGHRLSAPRWHIWALFSAAPGSLRTCHYLHLFKAAAKEPAAKGVQDGARNWATRLRSALGHVGKGTCCLLPEMHRPWHLPAPGSLLLSQHSSRLPLCCRPVRPHEPLRCCLSATCPAFYAAPSRARCCCLFLPVRAACACRRAVPLPAPSPHGVARIGFSCPAMYMAKDGWRAGALRVRARFAAGACSRHGGISRLRARLGRKGDLAGLYERLRRHAGQEGKLACAGDLPSWRVFALGGQFRAALPLPVTLHAVRPGDDTTGVCLFLSHSGKMGAGRCLLPAGATNGGVRSFLFRMSPFISVTYPEGRGGVSYTAYPG